MIKKEPKIKIFVSHHKPGYIYEDYIFVPIQVGKKNAKVDLGILGDDTGDNISHKNNNYAELTAQYWVWKNYDLSDVDYVGFCHYRRYFSREIKPTLKDYLIPIREGRNLRLTIGYILTSIFSKKTCKREFNKDLLSLESKSINKYLSGDIILVSPILSFTKGWVYSMNISDEKILNKVLNFMKNKFPKEYETHLKIVKNVHKFNFCNMYIMRKEIFSKYCERLFNFLFQLEKELSGTDLYPAYKDKRFEGILAERLFNIRLMEYGKKYKIKRDVNELFFY